MRKTFTTCTCSQGVVEARQLQHLPRRPPLLRQSDSFANGDTDTYSYCHSHSYRYSQTDADAKIGSDTETPSHAAAETVEILLRENSRDR